MTLPPSKVGDKGQRWEARVTGYPTNGENIIGWASSKLGAIELAISLKSAPRALRMRIIDRQGIEEDYNQEFKYPKTRTKLKN